MYLTPFCRLCQHGSDDSTFPLPILGIQLLWPTGQGASTAMGPAARMALVQWLLRMPSWPPWPSWCWQHGVHGVLPEGEECAGRGSLGGLGDLEPVRGAVSFMVEVSRSQQCSDRSMALLLLSAVKDFVQRGQSLKISYCILNAFIIHDILRV